MPQAGPAWDSRCTDWTTGISISVRALEIRNEREAAAWRPDGMGTSEPWTRVGVGMGRGWGEEGGVGDELRVGEERRSPLREAGPPAMPGQRQAPSAWAAASPSAAAHLPRPPRLHHRPPVYCLMDNTSVCTLPAFESFTRSASISALHCRLRALSGPSGGFPVASVEPDPASGHGAWVTVG